VSRIACISALTAEAGFRFPNGDSSENVNDALTLSLVSGSDHRFSYARTIYVDERRDCGPGTGD